MSKRRRDKFRYREGDVAALLGLPQRRLKTARDEGLARGDVWELIDRSVSYTSTGIKQLLQTLGLLGFLAVEDITAPLTEMMADVENEPIETVRVCEVNLDHNWIGVMAAGNKVKIKVNSSSNFRRDMHIRIRKSGSGYTFVGRCPRWPGKF